MNRQSAADLLFAPEGVDVEVSARTCSKPWKPMPAPCSITSPGQSDEQYPVVQCCPAREGLMNGLTGIRVPVFVGVDDDVDAVSEVEFLEDAFDVGADGGFLHVERLGDLPVGEPFGE